LDLIEYYAQDVDINTIPRLPLEVAELQKIKQNVIYLVVKVISHLSIIRMFHFFKCWIEIIGFYQ